MKKNIFTVAVLFCLVSCNSNGNKKPNGNNAGHSFDIPTGGWTSERIPFPISFAAGIPYKGVEDVRFAPGWGNPASEEYWSYEFLWWLDNNPVINEDTLNQNLQSYYTGLVNDNITRRNIAAGKVVPVKVVLKKINAAPGDINTYSGTVSMLDYMVQQPMLLNCLVHQKKCSVKNKTAILFEMSPQPFTNNVWQKLNQLQSGFDCNKQ
jgi:hypothetical protein